MSAWDRWCEENVEPDGRLRNRPEWWVEDIWVARRSDGLLSGHKGEGPFMSWEATLEVSLELYDRVLPLGQPWPDIPNARLDHPSGDVAFGAVYAWAARAAREAP